MPKFSILIPSWNNLDFLQLCIQSIKKNSHFQHEILVHVNEGMDGTLDWVKEQGIKYNYSEQNIGICYALNGLRALMTTDYVLYMNDDMYVCPNWDLELFNEIEKLNTNYFFLSATLLQPNAFWCKAIIDQSNYGKTPQEFKEQELLANYMNVAHHNWYGATWPPNVVHKDIWDQVGGYSIEFSPGMGSDPDFSAKLWMLGVRIFKGINASRVYHFTESSTAKIVHNAGSTQFLHKWGMTSRTFCTYYLKRGVEFQETMSLQTPKLPFKERLRNKLKFVVTKHPHLLK